MKRMRIETIDRVSAEFNKIIDNPPQIPNLFRSRINVWIVPTLVVAEFRRALGVDTVDRAFMGAIVTGQQFQQYASGEVKARGPGRSRLTSEPTVWEWPTWESAPRELREVAREMYLWKLMSTKGQS